MMQYDCLVTLETMDNNKRNKLRLRLWNNTCYYSIDCQFFAFSILKNIFFPATSAHNTSFTLVSVSVFFFFLNRIIFRSHIAPQILSISFYLEFFFENCSKCMCVLFFSLFFFQQEVTNIFALALNFWTLNLWTLKPYSSRFFSFLANFPLKEKLSIRPMTAIDSDHNASSADSSNTMLTVQTVLTACLLFWRFWSCDTDVSDLPIQNLNNNFFFFLDSKDEW